MPNGCGNSQNNDALHSTMYTDEYYAKFRAGTDTEDWPEGVEGEVTNDEQQLPQVLIQALKQYSTIQHCQMNMNIQ